METADESTTSNDKQEGDILSISFQDRSGNMLATVTLYRPEFSNEILNLVRMFTRRPKKIKPPARRKGKGLSHPYETLTLNEAMLFSHVMNGDSGKQLAANSGIKESTLRNTLHIIYLKLGVPNRIGAMKSYLEYLALKENR